ncbi:MAG: TetR/AcrR family transcriptional regulator, partial [Alphaproteobacteria bacterium]
MARDGTATKQTIETTALRLFVERGVAGTTTRNIAAAAKIAEGTIYRHFAGKDELAWQLFRTQYEALAEAVQALVEREASTAERITLLIETLCRRFDAEPYVFRYLLLTQHYFGARVDDAINSPLAVLERFDVSAMRSGKMIRMPGRLAVGILLGPALQAATAVVYGTLTKPLAKHAAALAAATCRALEVAD